MKANEAPEKIYIFEQDFQHKDHKVMYGVNQDKDIKGLIEYTRTDAFIEKAEGFILDTLEVKEVDLEKEIRDFIKLYHLHIKDGGRIVFENNDSPNFMCDMRSIAKHFFELGMRNTITEEDCKLIWNIGDEIPNMPEEEFFKELLKQYKAQKGE